MRISQPGFVLTLLLLRATTVAGAPCPEKDRGTLDAWKCYGEVEYTSRTAGEPDFGARFVVSANRERLHKKRAPDLMAPFIVLFATENAPSALPRRRSCTRATARRRAS